MKKQRQFRSRQGRSDKQYTSTMKAMTYGCITLIALTLIIILTQI
mgnify:CR=1 FL=1